MMFSSPLLKEKALARGKSIYPKVAVFSEILPLASKNRVQAGQKPRAASSSCTQELQALFGCLKKWEFDDVPCSKQHTLYMDCVHKGAEEAAAYRDATRKGTLGESGAGGKQSMTSAQFNKIQKLFPQPDLGKQPYRQMKRLPTQDYADDTFHRKHWSGKRS